MVGKYMLRAGVSMACLAVAWACNDGDGGTGDTPDVEGCTAAGEASAFVNVQSGSTASSIGSCGIVSGIGYTPAENPGVFSVEIDFSSCSSIHGVVTFRLSLPPGADIDLHVGDSVDVDYTRASAGVGPHITSFTLRREGSLVALGMASDRQFSFPAVEAPFELSLLSTGCSSEVDDMGCALWSRYALGIECEDGVSTGERTVVFDDNFGTIECDGSQWHVAVGKLTVRVEDLQICTDLGDVDAEIVILRHGDGLASL